MALLSSDTSKMNLKYQRMQRRKLGSTNNISNKLTCVTVFILRRRFPAIQFCELLCIQAGRLTMHQRCSSTCGCGIVGATNHHQDSDCCQITCPWKNQLPLSCTTGPTEPVRHQHTGCSLLCPAAVFIIRSCCLACISLTATFKLSSQQIITRHLCIKGEQLQDGQSLHA